MLKFNNINIDEIHFNNVNVCKIYFNGVLIYTKPSNKLPYKLPFKLGGACVAQSQVFPLTFPIILQ